MGVFLGAPGGHELHCSVPRAKAFPTRCATRSVGALSEIRNERRTVDIRRRKQSDLLVDEAPIRRKRPPIEIVQADAASIFRNEAHADDEAIRLPDKKLSFCASPRRSVFPDLLCSDKMLLGKKLHKLLHDLSLPK
jgi:hypothetical protein